MKKYKRIMSILMVALFAVGFLTFPVSINAEEKSGSVSLENGGLLFYTIIDDEASVTGYEGSAAEVGIPSEIEGCPVKKLDDEAFKGNTDITRVIIPDGVTEIGNMAFWGCSELVSVTVPDSVTTIGSKAFYSCSALSDLKLSLNITSLGNDVFVECVSLTQVSLPSAVKIGSNTFSQCEGLKKVTLAENLEKISEGMFNECVNLTEVNNFSSVKKIGAFAFYNCTKLPDITFSDSLEEIGDSAFYGCGSFVNVTVPGNVKSLGTGVFSSCVNLKKAKLGNGIKTVPYLMFAFCDSLENIEIPNTVTDIEKCAFWKSKGIIKITLPDSVERIGYYAFQDCESLTEFNIPDKVVSVGGDAIRGTAFYKNSDNWDEDCLYKNKVLFNVRTSLSAESVKVNQEVFNEVADNPTDRNVVILGRQGFGSTGVAEDGAGNLVDIRAARLQVAGSDDRNVAFEIIPGEGSDPRSVSSAVADVDQFVVQKGGNKLLNIVSGENNTELRGDSVAEIDPERFRIWSKTPEGDDVNNRVFEVNAVTGEMNKNGAISSPASVYIRRGAIELEGSPNSGATYKADEGVGYIEASRFVANNLQSDGHSVIEPRYANTSGYDTGVQHDRYMVNPAYTSVMHDIKLTTRGGARLSDILPDFINKGIYIVNNTYKDGINFNDLTITNDGGVIKATEATEIATTFTGENQWASPFMGMVPAPQCPPGHARVITITPASFQMAQTGDMVLNSDGRYYVQENAKANDLTDVTGVHSNGEVTGAILQPAHEIVKGVNPDGTPQIDYIYYLGLGNEPSITKNGQPYSPKPLYFQQSTWLKRKVIAYGNKNCKTSVAENGGCANFMGWATVMGFIYPYELYGPIINSLQGKPAVSKTEDALANQKVYWNVFPVRTGSMEAYATVYCYFDRTNIFGSGNDSSYVDQYDQLHNFRDVYKKTNAGTRNGSQPGTNENYLKRLNDPHLKYNDPW